MKVEENTNATQAIMNDGTFVYMNVRCNLNLQEINLQFCCVVFFTHENNVNNKLFVIPVYPHKVCVKTINYF